MKCLHLGKLFFILSFLVSTRISSHKTLFYNNFDIVSDAIGNINSLKNKDKNNYFMRVAYKKLDENTLTKEIKTYSKNFHAPSTCKKNILINTDASSFNAKEIRFVYKSSDKNYITQKVRGIRKNQQKDVKIALNTKEKKTDNKTLKA